MGYVTFKQERFCKRIGERDGDVFMSSKMMKFLNKRERERERVSKYIMGNGSIVLP